MNPMPAEGGDAPLVLRNARGDAAAIIPHGAQLLSWRPAGGPERIYLSPLSQPAPGVAVRGGTPVCFPQFSGRGPLPKHGYARTSRWTLVSAPAPQSPVAEARFQLDSALAAGPWDRAFCLVLVARLGAGWLELQLQAANTGRTPWTFTAALHTYLRVEDIGGVRVAGLQGLDYEDMVGEIAVRREQATELAIEGEVDRVYRDASQPLHVRGGGMQPLRITQQGFADTVVWNPGPAKAAALPDLPDADWRHMLCVEAGAIARPVELAPGKTWSGSQRLEQLA